MIKVNPHVPTRGYVTNGFDVETLHRLREESGEAPISVLTEKEFDLLQYAPSVLFKINSEQGLDFPISDDRARRQLETDLIAQYAVLESAVQHGYYSSAGFIHNKATALSKILRRREALDLWESEPSWVLYSSFPSPEEIDATKDIPLPPLGLDYVPPFIRSIPDRLFWVYQLKQFYAALLGKQKIPDACRKKVRFKDKRLEVQVLSDFKEIFGEDINVVMFGSATYRDGANKDYDFAILVDHIREEQFRELETANLRLGGKPVDVVLVRKKHWENYVLTNPFSQGIVRDGIVVAGNVEFPYLDTRESVLRSVSRSVGRMKTLHGIALNWAGLNPGDLIGKGGLLRSLSKVPRYILRSLLELKDLKTGGKVTRYTNSDLEEMLLGIGIRRLHFSDQFLERSFTETLLQNFLYKLMVQTAHVVDEFYSPTWVHNHKEQIQKINHPGKPFFAKLGQELEMERYLYEAWKIADLK